jgi:hypothetical protein
VSPPQPFWTNEIFWLYLALLLPFALCLVFYGFGSPWRGSPVGRAVFLLLASIVSVLLFVVVALSGVIGPPLTDVLRFALLSGVMAAGWVLFVNVIRLQKEGRRHRNADKEARK